MTPEEVQEKMIRFDEFIIHTKEYRKNLCDKIEELKIGLKEVKDTGDGILEKLTLLPCATRYVKHEARFDGIEKDVKGLFGRLNVVYIVVGLVATAVIGAFIGHVFSGNRAQAQTTNVVAELEQ